VSKKTPVLVVVKDEPLAHVMSRALNTGKPVMWNTGDPLPDVCGRVIKVVEPARAA
jgi:hypothetical protein